MQRVLEELAMPPEVLDATGELCLADAIIGLNVRGRRLTRDSGCGCGCGSLPSCAECLG